jgi:hypothetical protein
MDSETEESSTQTVEFTQGCGESQRNSVENEGVISKCQVHNA